MTRTDRKNAYAAVKDIPLSSPMGGAARSEPRRVDRSEARACVVDRVRPEGMDGAHDDPGPVRGLAPISDQFVDAAHAGYSATTGFVSVPTPSIQTSTLSPG